MGKNLPTRSAFVEMLRHEAEETDVRRGGNGLHVKLTGPTILAIKHDIPGCGEEKGQTSTRARHREGHDIRNFVTMSAMNQCYAEGKYPQMIGNFDASTFQVDFSHNEPIVTMHAEGDGPTSITEEMSSCVFLKWMYCCNAASQVGADMLVVAEPSIAVDEYVVKEFTGLSHGGDPGAVGYLVFCHSRASNSAFFRWYIRTVVIPFCQHCRESLPESERSKQSMFMVMDGENAQLQALDDAELMGQIVAANIDLGKGPASCSGTCGNACDRTKTFQAGKRVLKSSANGASQILFSNPALTQLIDEYLNSSGRFAFTALKRRHIAQAVSRLLKCLGKVMTPQITAEGFNLTGVYTYNRDTESFGPSAKDENECSQLTEEEMDKLGIPKLLNNDDRRVAPKDERALANQRAVMLTGKASRERRQNYLNNRKGPKKQTKIAKKILVAEENGEEKKEDEQQKELDVVTASKGSKKIKKKKRKIEFTPPSSPKNARIR